MESGIQSSFIPKDAGKASTSPRFERSGGLPDLLLLIAIVLFVASCALAGGVFLYQQYLSTSAESKLSQLKSAQEAFDPALIHEITRLDDRMRIADQVLGRHLAPTAIFLALQQATLSTISFTSLTIEASDPAQMKMEMQGIAQSVNSIALEADILSRNGVLTNPIFSGITRQQDGVHFKLEALINPAAINYVALLSGAARATQQETQKAAPPTEPVQVSPFGNTPSTTTPAQSGGTLPSTGTQN
jgi:Tfp pilus assembly protein PilN